MLEHLIFSLDRVLPFFLLMVLGYLLRRTGRVTQGFFREANRFVYGVALPVNLFCSVAFTEGSAGGSAGFLLFGAVGTLLSFGIIWGITELLFRDKTLVGTLVQGGFRGNFALLGVPLAEAVAGPGAAQKSAMALLFVIPLYNILSVVALLLRGKSPRRPKPGEILGQIVRNPLILGVLAGILVYWLGVPVPYAVVQTLRFLGQTATPLGLLSIGGLFFLGDATARLHPALYAVCVKNILLPLAAVPTAYSLGFRGEELMVFFVLFGAPVAVSSFPMASALGGDGPLAANILILSTFLSAFVFAAGIYVMRTLGIL